MKAQQPDVTFLTPKLAGTLRLGIEVNGESKWLADFSSVKKKEKKEETYYILKDAFIGKGEITWMVKSLVDSEGAVMKWFSEKMPDGAKLIWAYGGASNEENVLQPKKNMLLPEYCYQNVFSIEGHSFTLYYGTSRSLRILEVETPPGDKLRLCDANKQANPLQLLNSGKDNNAHVVGASVPLNTTDELYFCVYHLNPKADYNYFMLPQLFEDGYYRVNEETEWMKSTPD
ncbi:DUF4450 domain-containing protein [Carboxylicivirga linearis]|uniref:DUF4450 domain-containing protein n=1 Tax=Carboxylicivirga linearis TaxID=1628157 RepID=A0ABS5JT70_9BACT|nr:DUF4450 domain-containing protein [Carboxylicivirga linearis]MBS2098095.1 DUF4450 domain-containing protein [Carboxylicivirga linearis]